jgi:hypothetical protein
VRVESTVGPIDGTAAPGEKYNQTQTKTTTEMRKNPDGSYSKITKTVTTTTRTLFVNTETVMSEDRSVKERPLKDEEK